MLVHVGLSGSDSSEAKMVMIDLEVVAASPEQLTSLNFTVPLLNLDYLSAYQLKDICASSQPFSCQYHLSKRCFNFWLHHFSSNCIYYDAWCRQGEGRWTRIWRKSAPKPMDFRQHKENKPDLKLKEVQLYKISFCMREDASLNVKQGHLVPK